MKNRFYALFLLAAALLCVGQVTAQDAQRQRLTREQLAEVQARHIAKELAMDADMSQRFTDVYLRCQQEIWALGPKLGHSQHPTTEVAADRVAAAEAAAEQVLKERFERSQQLLAIRQKYYAVYSEFLTQSQIQRVYESERRAMKRLGDSQKRRK